MRQFDQHELINWKSFVYFHDHHNICSTHCNLFLLFGKEIEKGQVS